MSWEDNDDYVKKQPGIITDPSEIARFLKDEDGSSIDNDPEWKEERFYSNWSYDLRLGDEVYLSSKELPIKLTDRENIVSIKPGEFALLITREIVKLPGDVMAFINIRFRYKQRGLINVSGFHVDPHYCGKLIFSIYNASSNDILLRKDEKVFMIFFQKLPGEIAKPEKGREGFHTIPLEMVANIRGQSATLASNAERIRQLEFYFKVLAGVTTAIFTVLVGTIIKLLLAG